MEWFGSPASDQVCFGKFDPESEEWTVYELPDAENQIPYALNVDKHGIVWICGTGNDTINRFDPGTETLVEIRLPMRVSYTREIEFDDDGNVWTSTSGPARHMERGVGAVIRISLPNTLPETGGVQLAAKKYRGDHSVGNLATSRQTKPNNSALFSRIELMELPDGYAPQQHQRYVDAIMANLPENRRGRVGQLWGEFRDRNPERKNDGQMFVRILNHVASDEIDPMSARRFIKKWQHHYFGSAPDDLRARSIQNGKLVYEQAACSRCHTIAGQGAKYGPDLTDVSKRFQGSKLLQQIVNPSSEIHKEFQTQMILVDDGPTPNRAGHRGTRISAAHAAESAEARQNRNDH